MNCSNTSDLHRAEDRRPHDGGFTLVEVLIVIVVIGIVSTVVVFMVRGIVDRGEDSACKADRRILSESVELYFAENAVTTVPATGDASDPERYERTLIETGRLGEFSPLYNVNVDGTLTIVSSTCI